MHLYFQLRKCQQFLKDSSLTKNHCFFKRSETGEKAYIVPVGGSDAVGFWGYLNAFEELLDQVGGNAA